MKISNLLLIASVSMLSVIGCSKDEDVFTTPNAPAPESSGNTESGSSSARYASWVYVMDVRFSRETCATGPGVCFKNEFGSIWNYNFVDNSTDGDVGPIGVQLDGDQLHLAFYRSLEEDTFIVKEDVKVSEKLCRVLGRSIVIKAGEYAVSYDAYKHGEALVDIGQ